MGGLPCRPPITLCGAGRRFSPCHATPHQATLRDFSRGATGEMANNRPIPRKRHLSSDHAETYAPAPRWAAEPVIELDGDVFDRAAGKPEDAVLRHRQVQRVGARQTGIKAAQDPGHDAMADRDHRAVADRLEPSGDAPGKPLIALAVGGLEVPFKLLKTLTHPGPDLGAVEPVPRAERNL